MIKMKRLLEIPERFIKSFGNLRNKTKKYKYEISIVAIIKNEAAYIEEWINYHYLIGVEHFYILDNGSEDNTRELLQKYVSKDIITLIPFEGRAMQLKAYNYAIKKYSKESKYMAFIDADEFIFLMDKEDTVKSVVNKILNSNSKAGGLAINWRMFGSSGFIKKPEGGVLENYLYRAQENGKGNDCIKTIVRTDRVYKYIHPHYPLYLFGFYSIDENGKRIDGWSNPVDTTKLIRINHYFTKSKEEWITRRSLGKVDKKNEKRTIEEFYLHDNNDIYDDSMLYYIDKMKDYKNFSGE